MKKFLYTTHADLSLDYFSDWEVKYYDAPDFDHEKADLVYFRDPFNDDSYIPNPTQITKLIQEHHDAYIIDRLEDFDSILEAEDKLLQSRQYQDLYPRTWLPSQQTFITGKHLAKPRISQRAKDILFELGDRDLDDNWIIQELLDVKEELRVYAIKGEIIQPASVKSPKSSGAVKVIGVRTLTIKEEQFIRQALQHCPLDLVGFDLAILQNGEMKIIEANRSPQFRRYAERTGINLAELIARSLT